MCGVITAALAVPPSFEIARLLLHGFSPCSKSLFFLLPKRKEGLFLEILYQNILALGEHWQMMVMWLIGGVLIFLAIKKEMEPTLLLPMGFGAILVNLPESGAKAVVDRLFQIDENVMRSLTIKLDFEPVAKAAAVVEEVAAVEEVAEVAADAE